MFPWVTVVEAIVPLLSEKVPEFERLVVVALVIVPLLVIKLLVLVFTDV